MPLREDLRTQRRALLLGLAMVVAGIGATGLAHLYHREAEDTVRLALAEKNAFQSRLARMAQEEQEIQAGDALFRQLAERGILGEEKRMDWLERIARIRAERRLGDIQWEISPQRPLEAEFAPGGKGELEFMASSLRLRLSLLHEEDLLRFIKDLKDSMPAYVRIRQCSLERLPRNEDRRGPAPQLQAECQVDLITLRKRASAAKQP
ncbi:MAG: hypothetical protein PHU46_09990 [Rhodocyclaceae bacterium]|nr:hypothetical protein [Rhodocyclaceae bacterium]